MSYFNGMTTEQIAALTFDEVVKRIDLACAAKGIPLFLGETAPERPAIERDMTLYRVAGILFADEGAANHIAKEINAARRMKACYYNYQWQKNEFEPDDGEITIEKVLGYKPETWHARRAELTALQDAEAAAATLRTRNKAASDQRATIATEVWKEHNAASEKVADAARIAKMYAKYVTLADGDREMARKFLIAAENLPETWQPQEEEARCE